MGKTNIILVFLFLLLISPAAYAQTIHVVGDNAGWATNVNYEEWSQSQTFMVGEFIRFNFDDSKHLVCESATKEGYDACGELEIGVSCPPYLSPVHFELTSPGIRYFFCPSGNPSGDHCRNQGMKITVNVTAAPPPSLPPPSPPPPSPPPPPPPSPSPPPPSPPPPSPSPPPPSPPPPSPSPPPPSPPPPSGGGVNKNKSFMLVFAPLVLGLIIAWAG